MSKKDLRKRVERLERAQHANTATIDELLRLMVEQGKTKMEMTSRIDTLQGRGEYIQREAHAQIGATNDALSRMIKRLNALHEIVRAKPPTPLVGNDEVGWYSTGTPVVDTGSKTIDVALNGDDIGD